MKAFRDELLEYLLGRSGEMVDIDPIIMNHCGQDKTFENGDETLIKCRLSVNRVLRELQEMGWLNVSPPNGLSTGHHMNHDTQRREFIIDHKVSARLTTKGEIEYNSVKKDQQKSPLGLTVGDGFSGVIIQDSDLRHSPINSKVTETPGTKASTTAISGLWKFMENPIAKLILGIITGLAVAYFAFVFKWRR